MKVKDQIENVEKQIKECLERIEEYKPISKIPVGDGIPKDKIEKQNKQINLLIRGEFYKIAQYAEQIYYLWPWADCKYSGDLIFDKDDKVVDIDRIYRDED